MQGRRSHRTGCMLATTLCAFALLAPAYAFAQSTNANSDTAYVDGSAGRAVADPARADGGGPPPAAAPVTAPQQPNAGSEMQLMQQMMAVQQAQLAQLEQQQQAVGAMAGQAPSATPAQQIGAGMAQDAASLLDAGIQRQIYGSQGPVIYNYPGMAPPAGDFEPPSTGP